MKKAMSIESSHRRVRTSAGTPSQWHGRFGLRRALAVAAATLALAGSAGISLAQGTELERLASDTVPIASYRVDHDHALGSGRGELRITEGGFEYRGTSEDESRHSRAWRYDDVKRIEVDAKKITIVAYEAGSIPLLPRQFPFVKDTIAVPAGAEHRYEFRLEDDEVAADVVRLLEARFPRSIATSVVPSDEAMLGRLDFEIPVFHRQRAGGRSGSLRVYERRMIFAADEPKASQAWRYVDVRSISRLSDRRIEVTTYEGQFGPGGKDYVFDLKRPMTDREYDTLWSRVYGARFSDREP
jgi:hypothetical protein